MNVIHKYKKAIGAGEYSVVKLSIPLNPINLQYPF